MKKTMLFILLIALALGTISNLSAQGRETGTIRGNVRRIGELYAPFATIIAGTYMCNANLYGSYSLTLPAGTYSVSAWVIGYHTLTVDDVVVTANQVTVLDFALVSVAGEDELNPVNTTALKGNSPNPFNPTTTIYYDILEPCNVRLDVYNVRGQKVRSLLNEAKDSGSHSIVFVARDDNGVPLSSGVYFYRFMAGKYNATRKMLLME